MSEEDLIIQVYCLVDEMFKEVVGDIKIRKQGKAPAVTDQEGLTMLII